MVTNDFGMNRFKHNIIEEVCRLEWNGQNDQEHIEKLVLKLIPGLGSAINATVAATLTGAMGLYVKSNFEESAIAKIEGRPAPDLGFDVELFKKFYAEYKKNQTEVK